MTAKDLLHKYLNYDYLWRVHTEDKPSKIRLQQLNILFEVFNISKKNATPSTVRHIALDDPNSMTREQRLSKLTALEYFETGEFLHDRPYATNKEVVNKATSAVGEISEYSLEGRKNEIHLSWLFSDLLSYRKQA